MTHIDASAFDVHRQSGSQHGANAALEATLRAGRMLDRGDSEGWLVWARVRLAIEMLRGIAAGRAKRSW